MNIDYLKTFISVVEKKSFSETAKVLHLSQPTVTAHIKALEKQFELQLFERTTKYVQETPAAQVLYRYARDIMKRWDEASAELMRMSTTIQGRLEVSCSLTIGDNILPKALKQLKNKFPYIQINADIANTEHILAQIKDHTLDIGLVEAPVEDSQVIVEPFMEDELMLIAPPDYFEPATEHVTLDELSQLPLVLREAGSGTRRVMEQHLARNGIPSSSLNIFLELGSTESVKSAVEAGLGVSIISQTAIRKELQLGTLQAFSIRDVPFTRSFYIVYHQDTVLNPQTEAFRQTILTFNMEEH